MTTPISNMAVTWNASTEAVNTAIGMNVTDTQSDANSRLISLKVNSNDRLYVTKDGSLYSNSNVNAIIVNVDEVIANTITTVNTIVIKSETDDLIANNLTANTATIEIITSNNITSNTAVISQQPAIFLDGNNGTYVNFLGGEQLLVSTYYDNVSSRGNVVWDSTEGTVTVPLSGWYNISFSCYVLLSSPGNGRLQIRKSNTLFQLLQTSTGISGTSAISFSMYCDANDYISIVADAFDSANLYMGSAHTHFSLHFLG